MLGWGRVRRRKVAVGVAVVFLVAGVGTSLLLSDGDADLRAGSTELDEPAGLFEVGEPLDAYRIDYRVESRGGDEVVVTSDRLVVRRPFESRLETFDGPVPDGEPSSVQIEAFGVLYADGVDSEEVVVAVPPGPPGADTRIEAGLASALEEERFELGPRREVLGRTCQVIRTAALLATGDLAPPGARDHAETCIDAAGLVLEEVLVVEGSMLLRRLAIDVDAQPDVDGAMFETGDQTIPVDSGGGFLAETEPDSRQPGMFFESQPPAGHDRLGRYIVIPPQQENFSDPLRKGHRLTYLSDVFIDGASVVVLDQGGTLGGIDPFPDPQGVEVDIDGLGTGLLSYGRTGPTLLVPRPDGKFLRVRGTVAPDVLVKLLEVLEEVEGGELRLRDG